VFIKVIADTLSVKVLILANKKPYGTVIFTFAVRLQLLPAAFNTVKVNKHSQNNYTVYPPLSKQHWQRSTEKAFR